MGRNPPVFYAKMRKQFWNKNQSSANYRRGPSVSSYAYYTEILYTNIFSLCSKKNLGFDSTEKPIQKS